MKVALIQATPNPVKLIADIASICYGNEEAKNPEALMKKLYESGHHSVFEHIYFTFKIEDISRACSHQLVRHRMCSFTQKSQRYCDESEFAYVTPTSVLRSGRVMSYIEKMEWSEDYYKLLVSKGVPKEDARFILPNACCTALYLSCNLRELIHMANERLCIKAQWEIRDVVKAMIGLVNVSLQPMLVPRCQSGLIICKGCEK